MDKNITVATMQFKEDVQVSTAEYLKTYYTFNLGDIAFEGHQSKEFRYGRFVENDIGNGIVSHIFAVFRPIQEYDLYFWKYAINNETLMQRILGRSTKASTMMHDLVANDFLNETFLVPSIDEQKQIGSLFNKLDHLITLHQWKHYRIKKIINSAWEQRKLIDEVTAIDTGKSKFTPKKLGVYEILGSTSVIGYDDSYDYEGDFLLTARVGANAGELYRYSGKVKISDNTVFIKGEQLDFIYYALLHFDIKRLSFGTGQPLVKASELKVQDIMMPVDDDERSAIGTYFSNLDNLITLHQQKYKSLKKLKKFMVKNMFLQVKCKNTEKDR